MHAKMAIFVSRPIHKKGGWDEVIMPGIKALYQVVGGELESETTNLRGGYCGCDRGAVGMQFELMNS
jgi:hypothetical protein